jgi:general secretion pathway protein K
LKSPSLKILKARQRGSGIALILVVFLLALLIVIVSSFAYSVRVDHRLARNRADDLQVTEIAYAGLELAKAMLRADQADNKHDWLGDKWSTPLAPVKIEGATLTVEIVDEDRKLNINDLVPERTEIEKKKVTVESIRKPVRERIIRAVEFLGLNLNAGQLLKDLEDKINDEETAAIGAEKRPFIGRPFHSLDELIELESVERADLYGEGPDDDLEEILSVAGTGRVNLNTASRIVLLALSEQITGPIADAIIERREELEGFTTLNQLTEVSGISQELRIELNRVLKTTSSVFSVTIRVDRGQFHRTVRCLVQRGGVRVPLKPVLAPSVVDIQVLRWQEVR